MLYLAFRLSKHLIDLSSGDWLKNFLATWSNWKILVFFFISLQKAACIASFL